MHRNEITAQQQVFISPVPDIQIDPTNINICTGDVADLNEINVTDLNNTNITITFHSGTPPNAGNEVGNLVTTDFIQDYYILATNDYGCEDVAKVHFNNFYPENPQCWTNSSVM